MKYKILEWASSTGRCDANLCNDLARCVIFRAHTVVAANLEPRVTAGLHLDRPHGLVFRPWHNTGLMFEAEPAHSLAFCIQCDGGRIA